MIRARGLRKSFSSKSGETVEAVKGIDLDVRRGEAFGFLGPNGAGKSSTMRMIAAVSPVSGGELRILGHGPRGSTARRSAARLGVCPQEDTLDNELNVFDNLYIYGRYFGIPKAEVRERAEELLEFVQLTEKRDVEGRGPLRRHEAPPHHRPLADQPARPPAARRADHRPRPPGPPRRCGTGCSGSSSRA